MEQDENDGFFVPHGYLSSDEEQHDENGKWIDFLFKVVKNQSQLLIWHPSFNYKAGQLSANNWDEIFDIKRPELSIFTVPFESRTTNSREI